MKMDLVPVHRSRSNANNDTNHLTRWFSPQTTSLLRWVTESFHVDNNLETDRQHKTKTLHRKYSLT